MPARRLTKEEELRATLSRPRAIVYLTVDWSSQERASRATFARFVERIEGCYPDLGVAFWLLGEECEGLAEWHERVRLLSFPGGSHGAGGGYGAVVWLGGGVAVDVVDYAAAVGVEGLVDRTLRVWGPA